MYSTKLEAVRDPGSTQLSTLSLLECGPHSPGPVWLPDLSHHIFIPEERGEGHTFSLLRKVGEIESFFLAVVCTAKIQKVCY